jgi:hypothetical protein
MNIPEHVDEIIGISVVIAGTIGALYITYLTKQIPEFFSMGFGMVLAYYFTKSK